MTLAHSSASAGKPCAGCSKFPTYIDYNAHGIPIATQSCQGHASSFIKHSYARSHIRLLTRQIHNTRTLPTAAATLLARLRRSLPACIRCSLPAAALLFSSPTAPCLTTVMGTQWLACRRLPVDVVAGDDDKPPPQATSWRGSGPSNDHENKYFIRDRG
jgi:hypothetical protein